MEGAFRACRIAEEKNHAFAVRQRAFADSKNPIIYLRGFVNDHVAGRSGRMLATKRLRILRLRGLGSQEPGFLHAAEMDTIAGNHEPVTEQRQLEPMGDGCPGPIAQLSRVIRSHRPLTARTSTKNPDANPGHQRGFSYAYASAARGRHSHG